MKEGEQVNIESNEFDEMNEDEMNADYLDEYDINEENINEYDMLQEIAKSVGNIEKMVHFFYMIAVWTLIISGAALLIMICQIFN